MRSIVDGVKVDWTEVLLTRIQKEKGRLVFVNGEWTANTVTSLFNKVTVLLVSLLPTAINWTNGVRSYTKQKGLLTRDEHISGPPDSNDESDNAKELRRRLGAAEGSTFCTSN